MRWKADWIPGEDGHHSLHNDLAKRLNRVTHIGDPGVTWQAALDAGGIVFVPDGTHTLTEPLTLKSNTRLLFESVNAKLVNNTTDVFTGGGVFIEIAGGMISSSAGHVFALDGISESYIHDCWLGVSHPDKSIFTSAGGYIGNVVERCWLDVTEQHSVPAWLQQTEGNANGNVWRDLTCNHAGNYVFWIENTSNQNYAYDNRFENIIFEKNVGGSIKLLGCAHTVIDNCHEYDIQHLGDVRRDLIFLGKHATGTPCRNVAILNCGRRGGSDLVEGVYDINLDNAHNTLVMNCVGFPQYQTRVGPASTGTIWINDGEHGTVLAT